MTFDWQSVLVLWIVVGFPGCAVASITSWFTDHAVLALVFGLAAMILLTLAAGLHMEVFGV